MHRPSQRPIRLRAAALVLLAGTGGALAATPAEIYHDFCSVCHGDNGDGKSRASGGMQPPPRDFTHPQAAIELTRERMIAAVADGRPGTAMSAWKHQLTAADIAGVVDYIRQRFMLPATTAGDDQGRRLYAEYCSVCHGDRGNGQSRASGGLNPPPRDFTAPRARAELTRERMLFAVRHGRADTAMAGWSTQLDETQIAAVVDYVIGAFMDGSAAPAEPPSSASGSAQATVGGAHVHEHGEVDMGLAMPHGLVGDPDWGEAFYNANCAVCHGAEGDGKGPRAYFIVPKPRDFGHPAARASLNRPHLYEAIAHGKLGTEMPAWRQVLEPQHMANVAEYVFRAFIVADSGSVPSASDGHPQPGHAHGHDEAPGQPHGH